MQARALPRVLLAMKVHLAMVCVRLVRLVATARNVPIPVAATLKIAMMVLLGQARVLSVLLESMAFVVSQPAIVTFSEMKFAMRVPLAQASARHRLRSLLIATSTLRSSVLQTKQLATVITQTL